MRYEIKELGLGGILDQAIKLMKNHFGLLFGVTLVLLIPCALGMNFLLLANTPELPANATMEDRQAAIVQAVQANIMIMAPMFLFMGLIVGPLTNAAVIHAIASEYLEQPTTVGQAMQRAIHVILPLFLTGILQFLAIMGGLILCIVPGIIFALWFILVSHVIVIEGSSGTAAMSRSKDLMKGNIATVSVLGILVAIIQVGITFAAGLITQPHAKIFVEVFAQAIMTIFVTSAVVVFYFSCRCKFENFDLTLLAQAVGVESPGSDSGFDSGFESESKPEEEPFKDPFAD